MPKPIAWTHRDLLESALTPWFGEVDLAGVAMGCHSLPMFHGMGMLHLCFAPSCGVVIATFKPSSPAILPTPNHVFRGLVMTNSLLTCCIPSFIEQWSHDPEKVAYMQKMQGVIYGGGPLSKETGDRLASQGVSIYSNYACTELGVVNTYLSKNPGMEWEWFTFSGQCRPELIPYGDGTYEFIAISHITNHPKVLNTKVGNHDAYATSDLLVPHPTKPSFWKVFGRADDQIMLSTGEMTNPGPLEHVLSQDFWIRSAVMFGRGRFQNGVLIDPRLGYGFDPENVTLLENFRNNIWSSVERMNAFALPHSRVSKEMILVASPSKPFEYTAKNTPRRPVILAMYREEISALYDAVERTMQREFNAPLIWSSEEILDFVRAIVANALARPIADDADIFECGCDSVQATWIRNSILRALRERDPDAVKRVSANFVFRALSVTGLVKAMSDALEPSSYGLETSTKVEALQRMVERYASAFPLRPSTSARTAQEGQDVVLVTGTTSGFGCDILAELLQDASVNRVYAFNHNPRDVTMRQRAAFRQRGLDEALLLQPKYQHVEGDLSVSGLNIDPQLMQEIRNSTTHIIHNAWQVDQTLSHASFENNVKALRNLVDLALSSPLAKPPRLLFVSSIGVLRNSNTRGPALEVSNDDASLAAGSGYTESKWIAERILDLAARSTDLRPITVRLGQICGDRLGHWNEREWFPSMVKSALFQRCLPDLAGTVSWIPASEAAAALVEMRNSSSLILHLAHPRPVSWTSIIDPLAKDLGVPLVPYSAWVATLHKSPVDETAEGQQLGQNPALRLIHFFRNCKVDEDKEPLGITRLATDKAMKVAPSLNIQELGVEHVKKWLSAWRSSGFLPARKRD
ncbi:putative NRPS-like protein biosynthetic cluster, variant 2 [Taiwanofungus camphoratus]|nr:putative NRPS-like protein biosynthetic cluster, variant 2 [Antrodia cinnamomea]